MKHYYSPDRVGGREKGDREKGDREKGSGEEEEDVGDRAEACTRAEKSQDHVEVQALVVE